MSEAAFENICMFHILDGLCEGLSHFSQQSRAAIIYARAPGSPPRICDPQGLLEGHEPKLRDYYLYSSKWRDSGECGNGLEVISQDEAGLDLSGIITLGARSQSMGYQMWFTEEHPDMCSTGPTRSWLEYAAELVSQSFQTCNIMGLDTAGFMLQHCAPHAIRDFIVDERSRMGWLDTKIRVYPFLDALIGVSGTKEEGAWPRGRMVVVEPSQLDQVRFVCRFPENEQPRVKDIKHVRKLLQAVEDSGRVLVADGSSVLGIAIGPMPGAYLAAQFSGTHGFLWIQERLVCSFSDGRFHSSNLKANLVQLEEQLLETDMDMESQTSLFKMVSLMVNRVRDRKHGCTLVVDMSDERLTMSGQHFVEPLDLKDSSQLKLACSLAKLDGALHLGRDLKLHGFACLMDGRSVPGENRARGARFNSALRFTAEHDHIVVVVVSADRPVSIIKNGVELTAQCNFQQICGLQRPQLLAEWVMR
ncbi:MULTISPECIES: DNA integrity scanning protein DisA nucleotide-binding domain protein [unclassified Pseudodesulfovibrio]|uniref:DNA integrity scanning protein DisA nucleotide-binding domain protein n=1 Tax=unclassified Pseudodesulfovibrio TaxID=2661612 RepID=UPI000FEBF63E|nr:MULTISPECIES: DNA integrity scanning protein DisA nucleotide-binding domain protein [unclassified Pseudodesulfovibrio]MCJ2165186.1 DNA integrity scanning protein DisA nucleotide-binding domain protein [Pseudodesulfovibrio sp. S3-i]RWU03364.1 DNA-binding protein [Pseudodesulfovibrio sp. S3]